MRLLLLACAFMLLPIAVQAQVVTPVLPDTADIVVIAAVGDPATLPAIATRRTALNATTCNQAPILVGPTPLINPTQAETDDPTAAGRKCRFLLPIGLPNGTFRAVAIFNYSGPGTCTDPLGVIVPCVSARSAVGVPPFDIRGTQAPPAAPTTPVVRP